MIDFFASDLLEALGQPGCPLCRAVRDAEAWELSIFLREGFRAPEVILRFHEDGGLCRRHAWLLHRVAAERGTAVPIVRLYGALVARDLAALRQLEANLTRGRSQRLPTKLTRSGSCRACDSVEASLDRKAAFLVEALGSEPVRAKFRASDGLCYPHFVTAFGWALEEASEVASFLVRDFRARLERLAIGLAEFDRKRDHRYANEPKGAEQDSWTEVIRRYVGEDLPQDRAG